MTFAFHSYSGMVLGILIMRLLGLDPWVLGIFGLVSGGFSDTADMVMYWLGKIKWWPWKRWNRWEIYVLCHPPYNPGEKHGSWDRYGKWIPFWFQHTWLVDSIVHVGAPRVLFPKFNAEWQNVIWIRIWPSHWNIQWTKWDVLYVTLEASLWGLYTVLLVIT